jgi:hypothetical protein
MRAGVAWLVPLAHGTEAGMEPDDLLCSRNARPPKALVGRAQWKINQPPSLERERASLEELLSRSRGCGAAMGQVPHDRERESKRIGIAGHANVLISKNEECEAYGLVL